MYVWHFNKAFYLTSNRQYYGGVMQKMKIDERGSGKKSIEKLSAEQRQAFALFGFCSTRYLHAVYIVKPINFHFKFQHSIGRCLESMSNDEHVKLLINGLKK